MDVVMKIFPVKFSGTYTFQNVSPRLPESIRKKLKENKEVTLSFPGFLSEVTPTENMMEQSLKDLEPIIAETKEWIHESIPEFPKTKLESLIKTTNRSIALGLPFLPVGSKVFNVIVKNSVLVGVIDDIFDDPEVAMEHTKSMKVAKMIQQILSEDDGNERRYFDCMDYLLDNRDILGLLMLFRESLGEVDALGSPEMSKAVIKAGKLGLDTSVWGRNDNVWQKYPPSALRTFLSRDYGFHHLIDATLPILPERVTSNPAFRMFREASEMVVGQYNTLLGFKKDVEKEGVSSNFILCMVERGRDVEDVFKEEIQVLSEALETYKLTRTYLLETFGDEEGFPNYVECVDGLVSGFMVWMATDPRYRGVMSLTHPIKMSKVE